MRTISLAALILALSICAGGPVEGAERKRYPSLTASGKAVALCGFSMPGIGIPLSQRPTKRRGAFGVFEFTPDLRELRQLRLGRSAPADRAQE